MTEGQPVFELEDVCCAFGRLLALDRVSLRIAPGERVALLGPSGAGKSTLIGLLNGTRRPTAGRVRLFGQDLAQLSPARLRRVQARIGTIHQQFDLVDALAVVHNVNAGHLGRWPWYKALASLVWPLEVSTAAKALTQVGIPEKLYSPTHALSGGQQQRVALARVLVQDPAAILADEPISSLDPERGREIMDLLRDLCPQGKTLVVSLHAVEYAASHCDRAIGLRAGRVSFDLPVSVLTPEHLEELYWIAPPG